MVQLVKEMKENVAVVVVVMVDGDGDSMVVMSGSNSLWIQPKSEFLTPRYVHGFIVWECLRLAQWPRRMMQDKRGNEMKQGTKMDQKL